MKPNTETKPSFNGEAIKDYLRREMRKRTWLAMKAGISTSYLDQIMRGKVPSVEITGRIAKLIGVKPKDLVSPS